jgi:uncharacterized protein
VTGLDQRQPLVLDVRSLQRRPGSMVTVTRSVPAPAGLGVAMARVPEGSPIDLDLRLESVLEGVLVSGTADLEISAECSRCLDPVSWHEEFDLTELFRYPSTDARGAVVEEDDESDDPLPVLEDDLIDLEPTLRDAVVLDLPLAPLCSEDCQGLCSECGARLADEPQHSHDASDPRWAALAALMEPDAQ